MKINKKATLATAGVLGVAAIVGTLGTMSYFTDTDSATNTFTFGNVSIDLIEKQRTVDSTTGCKTTTLEDFGTTASSSVFYPLVGAASGGAKDAIAMPADCVADTNLTSGALAENYVDKMVSVKNDGASAAWVRVYYAIPRALLDSNLDDGNETNNTLHFNEGTMLVDTSVSSTGYYWSGVYPHDGTVTSETAKGATWLLGPVENDVVTGKYHYTTTIDNIQYVVYYQDIINPLAAGATSDRVLNGFYLDSSATTNSDGYILNIESGESTGLTTTFNIPVRAVAVQDKGFSSTAEAVTEAFGANFNPFASN